MPIILVRLNHGLMKKIPYLAEAFVQVLQDARYQARMSQEDLARSVGCARSFISFIETKNNLPSLNAFMAMAEALGVPPDEMLRRVQSRIRSIENAREQPSGPEPDPREHESQS